MKYFGTDGIRGEYNKFLTPNLVKLATLGLAYNLNEGDKVIVGRDPRISSDAIFDVVSQALTTSGIKVIDLGVIPTPVVSLMIKELSANAGIMISASHNPFSDNGIKFFDQSGVKISDELEASIEEYIDNPVDFSRKPEVVEYVDPTNSYLEMVKRILHKAEGIKVALDCANGASYQLAKAVFGQLGAQVHVIGDKPDGYNINDNVGALHPNNLSKFVVENECDCGFCYDGDADRIIAIDNEGNILTGDHIMYLLAKYLKEKDSLNKDTLVATAMSNIGLISSLKELGIKTVCTSVGDRYVIQEMQEHDYNLGGEQSGHLILSDYVTTGDGILTSVVLLSIIKDNHKILNETFKNLPIYPQKLVNVEVSDKNAIMQDSKLQAKIAKTNEELGTSGRVLIRPSGTEELVRIMVEARDENLMCQIVDDFYNIILKLSTQ